jgi:hypothetical protein
MGGDREPSFRLCGAGENFLEIVVGHLTQSDTDDYSDANWISAGIQFEVGAFKGHVAASLRREDFPVLRDGLKKLYVDLTGQAKFTTMEEWIELEITGDGRGHFTGRGFLIDNLWGKNRLLFEIQFDQTELSRLIGELDNIVAQRPILGSPGGV